MLGLEDPANRLAKAVMRTAPMALVLYTLAIIWFHRVGHAQVRLPDRPWYSSKKEPSFIDILTTLKRMSIAEKTATLVEKPEELKTWLAQITELLVLAG